MFIVSAVAGGISDPTTMLVDSAVEVETARTMDVQEGVSAEQHVIGTSLLQARLLGCFSPKRLGKNAQEGLGRWMRQRRVYLPTVQA